MLEQFFEGFPAGTAPVVALLLAVTLAWVLAEMVARAVRAFILHLEGEAEADDYQRPVVRRPIQLVRVVAFVVFFVALFLPALDIMGIATGVGPNAESIATWFFESGLRIVVIAVLATLLTRVIALGVSKFERRFEQEGGVDSMELGKRAKTLGGLIRNGMSVFVFAVAILMVLQQLEFDIMPILTGAGILGLAVGFGAQTLVKDVISGFFIILENQVRVGDVALINGTGGLVEAIKLRTIVLRDLHGVVHVFPNGSINTLANMTKDFSYSVLDVEVAYKEDTDHVVQVLRAVGDELMEDPAFKTDILAPLEVLGVDNFGSSGVTIRIRFKTLPIKQWSVAREFRRRIKKAFDASRIEIPFPHLSVYFGEASRPFEIRQIGSPVEARQLT
jgi:moderate conductance mechanosensitive channel